MGTSSILNEDKGVVVFDTSCLLCSRFIKTLLRNDGGKLNYTGFESEFSKQRLPKELIEKPETVIFLKGQKIATKSEAVFLIINQLQYPLRLLNIFQFVPTFIADKIYDWIAYNRYKWFGQLDSCFIPTTEVNSQFLD